MKISNIKSRNDLDKAIADKIDKTADAIARRILSELERNEEINYIKSECVDHYAKQLKDSIMRDIYSYQVNNKFYN